MTPLTHHEILALVAPFTKRNRHVDLQASDRGKRRLVFKPVARSDAADDLGALTEQLVLEHPDEEKWRLTRTLTDAEGLVATLWTDGPEAEGLLQQISDVPPRRQFVRTPDVAIVYSYRIAPIAAIPDGKGAEDRLVLTGAVALLRTAWVQFDLTAEQGGKIPIQILPRNDEIHELPPDFLAVLGAPWHRLRPDEKGWRGDLYVGGREPERSLDGERKIAETTAHLMDTFGHCATEFHSRHQSARWGVVLRNIGGLLGLLAAMAVAPLIVGLFPDNSILVTLAYFWFPALLLALPFAAARVELVPPVLPRTLPETAWRPVSITGTPQSGKELAESITPGRTAAETTVSQRS